MKVLELKGYKSLRALNAFHTLMLGVKMLPAYLGESYEDFYERISEMTDEKRAVIIREAAFFVQLNSDEIEALASFCADENGVPYQPANIKNLGPDKLIDIICAVCEEIGRIKIDMVSDSEKKKSQITALT
jgi:hypothetical protein